MFLLNKSCLKGYCCGLVEGVDLVFRIVFQISDQDNVSYKIQKSFWHFQIKNFVSVVFIFLIEAKGYRQNTCFIEGFVCNRNFNNCPALPSENSTYSLKVETRTTQSRKVLTGTL